MNARISLLVISIPIFAAASYWLGEFEARKHLPARMPTMEEMDERMAIAQSVEEIPKADSALALSLALSAIENAGGHPRDYAEAIQCSMELGSPKMANRVYSQAIARGMANADVRAVAGAWGLSGIDRGRSLKETQTSRRPAIGHL